MRAHCGRCLPSAHLGLTLASISFTASRTADSRSLLRWVVEPAFEVCSCIARFCALTTDTTLGVMPLLRAACAMAAAVASMVVVAPGPVASSGAGPEAGSASGGGDLVSSDAKTTRLIPGDRATGGSADTAAPPSGPADAAGPAPGPPGPAVTADDLLDTVVACLRSVVVAAQGVAASSGSAEAVVAEVMAAAAVVVGLEAHDGDRAWLADMDAVVRSCLSPSEGPSSSSAAPPASVWGRLSQLLCLVYPRITEPICRIVLDFVNIVDAWRWALG